MSMNQRILELFEQSDGAFLSGEEISGQLNISRTAVWKHIERLREQGYQFEAVPRKGYRLTAKPVKLDLARVVTGLETASFGRHLKYYDEVESTQTVAHGLVQEGAQEGTLVLAEQQNAGRGRMGRKWHSPKGKGIWMSLILKPGIPLQMTPQLTLLFAVALCRTIRGYLDLEAGIKWPNDLLIRGRKVSGILLESNAEDERLLHVIAGVGISVNLEPQDYPEELKDIATSLAIEAGHPIDREALLCRFLRDLEQLYALYREQGFAPIRTLWEAQSVSLHRPIRVQTAQGAVEGTAESIDDSGALLIRLQDGSLQKLYSGVVEFR